MIDGLADILGKLIDSFKPKPKPIIPDCECQSFDEAEHVITDHHCVYDIMQMYALDKYGIEVNSWRVNNVTDTTSKNVVYLYKCGDREFSFVYLNHYRRLSKIACLTCGTCLGWEKNILEDFDKNHERWLNKVAKIELANKICNLTEERKKDDSN